MRLGCLFLVWPAAAGWLLTSAAATEAREPRPLRRAPNYPVPAGEAVGCYWERGRQFCGRYCYWEVNGRRYCQSREARATPQGAYIEDYLLDESNSTAYRRPYGRVRRAPRRSGW